MKRLLPTLLTLLMCAGYVSAQAPIITSFTPKSGEVGTDVTISVLNFSPILANNVVYFGGARANVTSFSAGGLKVKVPSGATYAPITVTVLGVGSSQSAEPFLPSYNGGGAITFGAPTPSTFATGATPFNMAVGDFNNDGKPDLASANFSSDNISVLAGNGTSNSAFGAATNYSSGAGSQPISIIANDFNNDGNLDLATANNGTDNVSVFLGVGDGSFQAAVNYSVQEGPRGIISGDVNNDGYPDIAVANRIRGTVSILLGNGGDGTFVSATNFTVGTGTAIPSLNRGPYPSVNTGTQPYYPGLGDLDGDGNLDLVASNFIENTISIRLGNGDGTFGSVTNYSVGHRPYGIVIGDVNGDGKLDLTVPNWNDGVSGGGSISVLLGNGDGTLADAKNFSTGNGPVSVSISDLNGDLRPDLATANFSANNLSILLNIGNGNFGSPYTFPSGSGPRGVTIVDFNLDGSPDLATANHFSNNFSILVNNTAPNVAPTRGGNPFYTGRSRNMLPDTTFVEDFPLTLVDSLGRYFSDPDFTPIYYESKIINGNASGVTLSQAQDTILYAKGNLDFNGTVEVEVTATDAGNAMVKDTFLLHVTPVNDPTLRVQLLRDTTFTEDFLRTPLHYYLPNFINDADGNLTYTATSISSTNGVTVFLSSDSLYVRGILNFNGKDTIRVTGQDGTDPAIADTFIVTVTPVDDPTILTQALRDTVFNYNFPRTPLHYYLPDYFADIDGQPLTYTASSVSLINGVTVSLSGDSLYVQSVLNFSGYDTIRVTAQDGANPLLSDFFVVRVLPLNNQPPIVDHPLPDTTVSYPSSGSIRCILKLTDYFKDADGDVLTFCPSSSDSTVAIPEIHGDSLCIIGLKDGDADISVVAKDGKGGEVADTAKITIDINMPPVVDHPLPDTTVSYPSSGSIRCILKLTDYFKDADGDVLTFCPSSSDSTVAIPEIHGDSLCIIGLKDGDADISVVAKDGKGGEVADTAKITIDINMPPVVDHPLPDTTVSYPSSGSIRCILKLTDYFKDADGDVLTFCPSSSDSTVAIPEIHGDSLCIIGLKDGDADISVVAKDGKGGEVADTARITIRFPDVTSPVLFAGVFTSEALDIARVVVGADESLSSVTATLNGQNITMTRNSAGQYFGSFILKIKERYLSGVYFDDYLLDNKSDTIALNVFGNDLSGNTSAVISKRYLVTLLSKSVRFGNYQISSASGGDGFLLLNKAPQASDEKMTLVQKGIEVISTAGLNGLRIETSYPQSMIDRLKEQYGTSFNERKIGGYYFDGQVWRYVGGQGRDGVLKMEINLEKGFNKSASENDRGQSLFAVFYNDAHEVVPDHFALLGNYPNPFNPTTTIRYQLPVQSKVSLKIYNMLGQEVRTLIHGDIPAGNQYVVWDGRNDAGVQVASGIYIYRLQANQFVSAKKLMLIK